MAQYWYEFGDCTPTKKPAGFLYRDLFPTALLANHATILGESYIELDSSQSPLISENKPVFMIERNFEECEILVKSLQRSYHSGNTIFNGGRSIGVSCIESSDIPSSGLLLAIGSSNDSTNSRVTRQYLLPNTDSNVGTATPLASLTNTQDKALRPVMTRIKVTTTTVQTRHWYDNTEEPSVWHLTYTHSFTGKKIYLGTPRGNKGSVVIAYSFVSISTNEDVPLISPLTRVRSGKVSNYYAGKTIRLRSPNSGRVYSESTIGGDGSWSLTEIICETVPSFNVFIEVDDGEILVPENINGDGYLGGDHPDGIVKENNAPIMGTVRVILKDRFGSSRDGFVVAETVTNQDGSWRVDGLNRGLRYDVVCRLSGYNDQIYSNVAPEGM